MKWLVDSQQSPSHLLCKAFSVMIGSRSVCRGCGGMLSWSIECLKLLHLCMIPLFYVNKKISRNSYSIKGSVKEK